MRCTIQDFATAVTLFEGEYVESLASPLHQFAVGVALASKKAAIDSAILKLSDDGKTIDVDKLRAAVDAGLKACKGAFTLPVDFGVLAAVGLTRADTRFTRADFDKFFERTLPQVARDLSAEKAKK